jgi:hypothetical protein
MASPAGIFAAVISPCLRIKISVDLFALIPKETRRERELTDF